MPGRWILQFIFLWSPLAGFAADNAYLEELIQRARQANLSQRAEWLNLLHYKPYPYWPGSRSLADDPEFFNAPHGKTDAAGELEATLAVFFSTAEETDKTQNPQCRFIARYRWLKQELQFDPARLPKQPCRRFYQWRASLDPHEITLVFPAAYLNNPASMYGHTLLRIDARDQDEHTRLLAYSISYAAGTDETSGLIFAVRGLFGGYPGVFAITPYYLKVREYSDIENRDVWEYQLTLTPEEIDRLLMHVWELGPTHFDYYFFDENCAYHLLSLLEVARPGLQLTDQFRWWAIPSDTVRAVTDQPGLLKRVVYRPASVSIMRQRLMQMPVDQSRLAKDLAQQRIDANDDRLRELPALDHARVLELGYEYASYEAATGRNKAPDAVTRMRELLLARSQLKIPPQKPGVPVPSVRPDEGHKTSRIGIGAGSRDGRRFGEIHLRPTYHDLLDQDAGYTRGAQIQFFDMRWRHYRGEDGLRLEEFKPLDIVSLSPRNDFFNPISWKINVGWTRKHFPGGDEPLVFRFNGGSGLAYSAPGLFGGNAVYYGFIEAALDAGSRFESNYTLGAGPAIGLLANVSERWGFNLQARSLRYGLGDDHWSRELALEQRYALTRQSAVRLRLSRKQEFQDYWNSGDLSVHFYF
ncbi:MAG: DUF4105 domain-containing protein [Sulfuricaulis sp.]|uniref:Lnb N-terminal periplasmic domain-containing protein n=1 Tax=Sulfuricaulis sp. TaxID=2003553 RepID=UPI0025E960FD|nr:DUF4105 domain-containing protein [Sulfuricaulis sp.]MCR4347969.1 DUF4105 domain-containing protein [Sulfuricaulis sp.]